jgi:hypothetical protein
MGQGRPDSFASTLKVQRSAVGSGKGGPELARPMTQLSRFSRFDGDPANGRNRRYLVVAARSGEGPFTDPLRTHSSRIANRYFGKFTATPRQAA